MKIQLIRIVPIPDTTLYTLKCRRGNETKEYIYNHKTDKNIIKFCHRNGIHTDEYIKGEE